MKRVYKTIWVCAGGCVLAGCLVLLYSLGVIALCGSRYTAGISELPAGADAILVLGAGLSSAGTPSDILRDRLDTALDIYRTGVCARFLLSGDHGTRSYNEVGAMKQYLMKHGVAEAVIFMDHAGFSTYDSMFRARNVFLAEKLIVVTTGYHLPRSLYLARKLGMEAWGVPSDRHEYVHIDYYVAREYLARIKDFFKVNTLRPPSIYLGDPIPIKTSAGSMTN